MMTSFDLWFGPPQSKILATPMKRRKDLVFVAYNKLQPQWSVNYIVTICNYQRFYNRSFVGTFELFLS